MAPLCDCLRSSYTTVDPVFTWLIQYPSFAIYILLSSDTFHSFIMLSTSRSLFFLFSVLCTLVQAKPHANPQRHHHHNRAVATPDSDATTESASSSIGIVYDDSSSLGAFSGRIGFSVDWSPTPLGSSDGLDLGTFIPQLWTFQDSNRESSCCETYISISGCAK